MAGQPLVALWPWDPEEAEAARERLRRTFGPDIEVNVLERGRGFAAALNALAIASPDADLAIVADACALPPGWLERLNRAASGDEAIAAATSPAGPDGAPALLHDRVHPRTARLQPHCSFVSRPAFELLGPFEESLDHPAAVLDEFAARAIARGLACVLADDVWAVKLPGGLAPCPQSEREQIRELHPWVEPAYAEEDALEAGPLRRSLVAARVAARGDDAPLSVTLDARALGPGRAGTQTYVDGLALALARSGRASVRAVVRGDAPGDTLGQLEAAGIEVVPEDRAGSELPRTDIAHRPQQAFVPEDLTLLRGLGERVVISHLDLISYRNPTYHGSAEEWGRYRRLTRVALAACDRVVFLSDHARQDAISEDLIEPGYAMVCGVGLDQTPGAGAARRPNGVPEERELLVMIGPDYQHKNRVFALTLVAQLRRRGWDGVLVLAGAHAAHGGSAPAEADLLRARPELAASVVDIGPVPEPQKLWLLNNAAAVLCPSTYEGFGLVPLEAAAARTPCAYAAVSSLGEVAGAEAATLITWDAAASAERVLPLLRAGEARDRHLAALREALGRYRWEPLIERLVGVYRDAIASPYRSSVPRMWEELEREQLIVLLDGAYHELRERTEHGRPLIDERGGMLSHDQQRGLMRIAARRWLRGPLLGPIGALGRTRDDDGAPSSK